MWQPLNLSLIITFLLVVILLRHSHISVNGSALSGSESLYHSNDNAIILATANFTQFVVDLHQDGQKLQLIQFYNSWCGHCISFAPYFKKFLKSVIKWKDLISISVVDCSIDENRKVCTDYNVQYYPTLRMFWFKPGPKDEGENIRVTGNEVSQIRETVIKWITDNWKKDNIPLNWPQFTPLTANNKEGLIEQLHLDNRTAVIVIEKDASYLGREIMMDLSRYSSDIKLYRMVESNIRLLDQILPKSLDTFKLPFLISINGRDRKFEILPKPVMSQEDDYKFFTKIIKQEFIKNLQAEVEVNELESAEHVLPDGKTVKYSSRVFMSDLNNAIRFALFHEVSMRKQLTVEQTNALIRFLNVLYENFHFQNDKTRKFIKYLHDWMEKKLNDLNRASNSGSVVNLEVEDLLATMNMYEEYYHFPEMKPWRACADVDGGTKRSYPCSMWSLFHVLTVAEYRRSLQLKQWSSLHAALYAMREYIRNFFGCTECAQHFVSMASGLENELTYPNSSVVWLWHAHNKVNARLKGTSSEVAQLPKRQFPTYEECSYCYRSMPDEGKFNNATQYRNYFDEAKVLQFFVEFYAAERLVLDKSELENEGNEHKAVLVMEDETLKRDQVVHPTMRKAHLKNLIPFVPFTSTDYSIIIVFYIVSITLLVSLCAFFKLRRNRNNRKSFQLLP